MALKCFKCSHLLPQQPMVTGSGEIEWTGFLSLTAACARYQKF